MANKKFKSGLIALIVILVITAGSAVFSILAPRLSLDPFENEASRKFTPSITVIKSSNKVSKPHGDYVAILYIEGQIQPEGNTYNQAWIASTIKNLKKDPKNTGILLYINSPGGTVYDADETYLLLQDYKTSGKPVYAYMGSMAASGGYYIACAADKIIANRNTLTGSIGVIAGSSIDLTEFLENMGIRYTTIHAGKNKNMGNYNEPFTDEQEAIMQSIADECYEQFTFIVSKSRDIPIEKLLPMCDGRVFTAKQALKNGLIDRITSYDEAVEATIRATGHPLSKTVVYRYKKQRGFFDSMFDIMSKIKGTDADTLNGVPQAVWDKMNVTAPMYLYQ